VTEIAEVDPPVRSPRARVFVLSTRKEPEAEANVTGIGLRGSSIGLVYREQDKIDIEGGTS
jgi:hypothetical protein